MDFKCYMEAIDFARNKINSRVRKEFDFESIQKKVKKRKLSEVTNEHQDGLSPESFHSPSEEVAVKSVLTISCMTQGENDSETLKYRAESEISEILKSDVLSSWEKNVLNEGVINFDINSNIKELIIKNHTLLHSLWQKLHTGHWSEVPVILRATFTWGSILIVRLLLKELHDAIDEMSLSELSKYMQIKFSEIVLFCDRGLMMGKPLTENPLNEIASLLNKFAMDGDMVVDETLPSICSSDYIPEEAVPFSNIKTLEFRHLPSLQDFLLNYMEKKLPLKIHGIADGWPALLKWNFKYFCEIAGARTVPVEIGLRYSDSDWSQVLMRINQYMKICTGNQNENDHGKRAYLAQHQLFDQIPELLSDIRIPDYCHMGEREPVLNAWIGPERTITPLHHDPDHNILVQVYGYKTILIFPESDSKYLYPFDDTLLNNTSKVNLEEVTQRKDIFEIWPLLKTLSGHYLILGPGDALYIPPKWWHYVRSLSNSISVSFWWR